MKCLVVSSDSLNVETDKITATPLKSPSATFQASVQIQEQKQYAKE